MNLRPLYDRVIIKREHVIEKETMIVLLEGAKEKPTEGIVLAVGPGKTLENGVVVPPSVKVGDRVLFGKYSGTDVDFEGKEVLSVREEDLIGVFEA